MPIDQCKPAADSPVTRVIDRRTMLAGTAGALVGAMFGWPSVAGARAASASFARPDEGIWRHFTSNGHHAAGRPRLIGGKQC